MINSVICFTFIDTLKMDKLIYGSNFIQFRYIEKSNLFSIYKLQELNQSGSQYLVKDIYVLSKKNYKAYHFCRQ